MKHIPHFEDLIFTDKDLLIESIRVLEHCGISELPITRKIDGAPAFIFGRDKSGFFVSTKSYFNKSSVRHHSITSIQKSSMPHGLKNKMILIYSSLITVRSIYDLTNFHYMGDFLFSNSDLITDGDQLFYRPNILRYQLPDNYLRHYNKIGVCIHTKINSDNGQAKPFGEHISFHGRVYQPSIGVSCSEVRRGLELIKDSLPFISAIEEWPEFSKDFQSVMMSYMGQDNSMSFDEWVLQYYEKKKQNVKTDAAKERWHNKYKSVLDEWKPLTLSNVAVMLEMDIYKTKLLEILDKATTDHIYVDNVDGTSHRTQHEGYVLSTNLGPVKFVDRQRFSKFNRDNTIIRGFELETV